MFAQKYSKFVVIALSLGIVFASQPQMSFAAKKSKDGKSTPATAKKSAKKEEKSAQTGGDETMVRAQFSALTKALADGDAKAVASLWTEDGSFTDEDGAQCKGRENLERRFASVFGDSGKVVVVFHPESIKMLDANVATSNGTVVRVEGGKANLSPDTRYSMVFLKQNGTWLISTATETPMATPPSSYESLQDLAWLIGSWDAQGEKGSVQMTAEWTADKNFITCKYLTKKKNESTPVESRQVIGWDPRTGQPISWHFDSHGGFGYGNWSRNDKQWLVDATGVEHDGTTSTSTNVISPNGANSFEWQSIRRTVNGTPVGDSTPLKIQRVVK